MLLPIVESKTFCWAWNRVYIKANGRIACWCDAGEPYTVVKKNLNEVDFVTDILNSKEMRAMRLTLNRDGKPFIKQCHQCCCYQTEGKAKHKRYHDSEIDHEASSQAKHAYQEMKRVAALRNIEMGSIDRISEMQLEPSFPCNLSCPGCLHGWHPNPLSTEEKPYLFPLAWFKRIIDSLIEHAVKLDRIAFVGRGEPTLNKQFPQMLEYVSHNLPNVKMSMDTNATQPFKPEYLLMDWINCSIDGSTLKSYKTYRYGGDFEKAITFMTDAVQEKKSSRRTCEIRWKYILFSTNSAKHLLNKAQEMARDIGIDTLNFVITACGAADQSVKPSQTIPTLAAANEYINNNKIFKNTIVTRS